MLIFRVGYTYRNYGIEYLLCIPIYTVVQYGNEQ